MCMSTILTCFRSSLESAKCPQEILSCGERSRRTSVFWSRSNTLSANLDMNVGKYHQKNPAVPILTALTSNMEDCIPICQTIWHWRLFGAINFTRSSLLSLVVKSLILSIPSFHSFNGLGRIECDQDLSRIVPPHLSSWPCSPSGGTRFISFRVISTAARFDSSMVVRNQRTHRSGSSLNSTCFSKLPFEKIIILSCGSSLAKKNQSISDFCSSVSSRSFLAFSMSRRASVSPI